MSMILDALRRARSDASDSPHNPALDFYAADAQPAADGVLRWRMAVWLLVVLCCGLLAALVWTRMQSLPGVEQSANTAQEIAQATATKAINERVMTVQPPAQGPVSPAQIPPAENPVATPVSPGPEESALPSDSDARPSVASPPALAPSNQVAALYARETIDASRLEEQAEGGAFAPDSSPSAVGSPESQEQAIDIEAVLARAEQTMGQPALEPHPAPLLENLSQSVKDSIPSLMYREHIYGPDQRAVVFNGQRLGVGDRHKGIEVRDILSDSVILSWGGTEFRLRALNSWINL